MKLFLVAMAVLAHLVLGGSVSASQSPDKGYWKVSFTAEIKVYNDGSIPIASGGGPVACFAEGRIGAVLYFPFKGGNVVAQKSFVTMNKVSCIECSSKIVSNSKKIPVKLSAVLDLNKVKITKGSARFLYEDFRIWLEKPLVHPVDILYKCPSGSPGISSDYGGYMSQIVSPFLTQVWSFAPTFGSVYTTTYTGFKFPPTYKADIKFNMFEEYAETIE